MAESTPVFTTPVSDGKGGRVVPPFLSPSEEMRSQIYHQTINDLNMRGWKQASVIRLLPWSLSLDGVTHQGRKIIGVPTDEEAWKSFIPRVKIREMSVPFIHHIVTDPYITVATSMRGVSAIDSFQSINGIVDTPIALAKDMVQQNDRFEAQGGMVAYEGNHAPGVEEAPAIELAFDTMVRHLDAKLHQSQEAHVSQNRSQIRECTRRNTWAIQYMINAGLILPPSWFTERQDNTKEVSSKCPNCQARVVPAALSCASCRYILNPFKAYGNFYTEENDGGMVTARRMTREQLQSLGLYPRIKPSKEWIEDQNEAAKKAAKETSKSKKED